jgi:hypothetical protein
MKIYKDFSGYFLSFKLIGTFFLSILTSTSPHLFLMLTSYPGLLIALSNSLADFEFVGGGAF